MSSPQLPRIQTRIERKQKSYALGFEAETQAKQWLEERAHRILAQNVKFKTGELDLVCVHTGHPRRLIVVEVKSVRQAGRAHLWVDHSKQRKLFLAANALLGRSEFRGFRELRLDLLTIEAGAVVHYPGYFSG
jgi:putative endonuclease